MTTPVKLSALKIQELLQTFNLNVLGFYQHRGDCVYIETINPKTFEMLVIYIPSAYKIITNEGDNVYDITYISKSSIGDLSYENDVKEFDIQKLYKSLDSKNTGGLHEIYSQGITIDKVDEYDFLQIRSILRQLYRIKFMVSKLNYKVMIQYKNYICSIDRHNELCLYVINIQSFAISKKICIIVDLKHLLHRKSAVCLDAVSAKKKLMDILATNTVVHFRNRKKKTKSGDDFGKVYMAYKKTLKVMEELDKLLSDNTTSETLAIDKLNNLHSTQPGSSYTTRITNDIETAETNLESIRTVRDQILQKIFRAKQKNDERILSLNQIGFDMSAVNNIIDLNESVLEYLLKKENIK